MARKGITNRNSRYEQARDGWKHYAPDLTFAGMTQQQFVERIAECERSADKVTNLENLLDGARNERDSAYKDMDALLPLLKAAIIGNPDHGPDSSLFEAFGGVRKSERKSGLTKKRKKKAEGATES